ncbi:hypothetical protein IEO21_05497 [Rhodonia placenta]|uniref:Uncharacterized protein n=1 Tax=Rhodonia placenta TaxID=104341 RepID=A0A8H7P1V3_9APHY|nr:hypothetical protein IEO21_05497 [Postia placenta]
MDTLERARESFNAIVMISMHQKLEQYARESLEMHQKYASESLEMHQKIIDAIHNVPRATSEWQTSQQHPTADLERDTLKRWKASPRYATSCRIGPTLPSNKIFELAGTLPKNRMSILVQSGHARLISIYSVYTKSKRTCAPPAATTRGR